MRSICMLTSSARKVSFGFIRLEKKKMVDAYINKGRDQAVHAGVNYAANNPEAFI